ncbi:MAG: hypothetical protein EOO54_29960 [Haliea sp.]|nr:MAG: hypothetical protein EOO54_29960 [Haliea sp.]
MAVAMACWLRQAESRNAIEGPSSDGCSGDGVLSTDWKGLCRAAERHARWQGRVDSAAHAGQAVSGTRGSTPTTVSHFSAATDERHGVRLMPWADWPDCLLTGTPGRGAAGVSAFWQQDEHGGFIAVGGNLRRLRMGCRRSG